MFQETSKACEDLIRKILPLLHSMSLSELLDLSSAHWKQFNQFNCFRAFGKVVVEPRKQREVVGFCTVLSSAGISASQLSTESSSLSDPVRISSPVLSLLPHVILTFTSVLPMSQIFASHT